MFFNTRYPKKISTNAYVEKSLKLGLGWVFTLPKIPKKCTHKNSSIFFFLEIFADYYTMDFNVGDEIYCDAGDFEGECGYVAEVYNDYLLVNFKDEDGVEVAKDDCMRLGTCEGCGSTGLLGNFCSSCEDSGYIYS